MKLLDILKKQVAPALLGVITMDAYRRQVYSHKRDIEAIKEDNFNQIERIQNEL